MADTVLAHIASQITQKENLATEALAFVLNRSPAARAALHRSMAALVGDLPPVARVTTQVAASQESRPDLTLCSEDGRPHGYIEAKFWAALTEAQPAEYVRLLADAGGGVLVLLAPARRLPSLRAHVLEKMAHAELSDLTDVSMRTGSVRIGLMSWSGLLAVLRDAVAEDRFASSDVQQLTGLVARFESEGFVPLTHAELDNLDVPRRVVALAQLVDEIVEAAVKDGILSVKGLRPSHGAGHTGRYIAFTRAGGWLGLSHGQWARHGRSPLWLRFDANSWGRANELRDVLRGWAAADPPRAYVDDTDRGVRVPLVVPAGAEKPMVVSKILAQLRDLDAAMKDGGMKTLANESPPVEG